jgi:hypothetical protein
MALCAVYAVHHWSPGPVRGVRRKECPKDSLDSGRSQPQAHVAVAAYHGLRCPIEGRKSGHLQFLWCAMPIR